MPDCDHLWALLSSEGRYVADAPGASRSERVLGFFCQRCLMLREERAERLPVYAPPAVGDGAGTRTPRSRRPAPTR